MIVACLVLIFLALILPSLFRLLGMIILLIVLGSMFNIAKAANVPIYNVDKQCAEHLDNKQAQNYCIEVEQAAYDTVSYMWPSMRPEAKQTCSKTAAVQPMWSYVYLRACLQADYERHQFDKPKSFKP